MTDSLLMPEGTEAYDAFARRALDLALQRLRGPRADEAGARPVYRRAWQSQAFEALREPLPQHGQPLESLLPAIVDDIVAMSVDMQSVFQGGFFNPPPLPESAAVETLVAALNNNAAGTRGGVAAVTVEHRVCAWLAEALGYDPERSYGTILSGGSLANLTAVKTALNVADPAVKTAGVAHRGVRFRAYASEACHYSIARACDLCGLGWDAVTVVPCDDRERIDIDALERAIAHDRDAPGEPLVPFLIVGVAGTTNTGAIDDLPALRRVADAVGAWFHVDGAYGAAYALSSARDRLAGIETADSITLDPHKKLFIPLESGVFLARDGAVARRAMDFPHASYLDVTLDRDRPLPDPYRSTIPCSRGFKALRLWVALKHRGVEGFRRLLDATLDATQEFARQVEAHEAFELMLPPTLGIVCFRFLPLESRGAVCAPVDDAEAERLNLALERAIEVEGRTFMGTVRLGGTVGLRFAVLHPDMNSARIAALLDLVAAVGETLPSAGTAPEASPPS